MDEVIKNRFDQVDKEINSINNRIDDEVKHRRNENVTMEQLFTESIGRLQQSIDTQKDTLQEINHALTDNPLRKGILSEIREKIAKQDKKIIALTIGLIGSAGGAAGYKWIIPLF